MSAAPGSGVGAAETKPLRHCSGPRPGPPTAAGGPSILLCRRQPPYPRILILIVAGQPIEPLDVVVVLQAASTSASRGSIIVSRFIRFIVLRVHRLMAAAARFHADGIEHHLEVVVIDHLREIQKRRLYLRRGFSSLFDYSVRELGYSDAAAWRRIKAMRLCADIDGVRERLQDGSCANACRTAP